VSTLAVAAISARLLAEATQQAGHTAVALDLFGDQDTQRACTQWLPIGDPASMRIDGPRLLAALAELARGGEVAGWIAGSGFEGQIDLLERGAALLPLIGTAPAVVRRVREAQSFFSALDRHGVAHPPVRYAAPLDSTGWLAKDSGGCGGWQVRAASSLAGKPLPQGVYFQREVAGLPMSATFVANGHDARVLGFNRQIVRRFGAQPFVFCGVVGPLALDAALARELGDVARTLAAEFGLRGLGSLDFMLDGDAVAVLEVNPRPPASLALYLDRLPMQAHLRACLNSELSTAAKRSTGPVRGSEIVFARSPLRLGDAAVRELAAWPQCHDLPRAGSAFAAGDPLCSLTAQAGSADEVIALLAAGREALLAHLETMN
jgi:uncharacterized protein